MIKRNIGERPAFEDIAPTSTLFMKELLDLKIEEVLARARRISKISRAAAKLCGENLQLEGNYDEQKIVWLTHEYIHALMKTPLSLNSPDEVEAAMLSDGTKDTVRKSSSGLSSVGFDRASIEYASDGEHFAFSEDGLSFIDEDKLLGDEEYAGQGCPYAKGENTPFHDKVHEKVVSTYAEAYRRDMPKNWLDSAKRFIIRK